MHIYFNWFSGLAGRYLHLRPELRTTRFADPELVCRNVGFSGFIALVIVICDDVVKATFRQFPVIPA